MEDRYSLRRVGLDELGARSRPADDPACEATVRSIMDAVGSGGEAALGRYARELDGNEGRLWYGPADFDAALGSLPADQRSALEGAAARVGSFAAAQLAALGPVAVEVPGGRAGQTVVPVERAGCYVPGGRYPLPSTVLMTALVARRAGVADVAVACPRPVPVVLAACAVAGVDMLLAAGGAQAIAAFVHGAGPLAPRDVVVGPGNRWVAAAKRIAQAFVRCDAPAGPSELLVVVDESADPVTVAWDLLAQAEHDPDAVPALAASSEAVVVAVERALASCLAELAGYRLESADIARAALANGWAFVSPDRAMLAEAANRFAPEHLELAIVEPRAFSATCRNAGAVFLGCASAEALGDYGAGPNHTLPTSGRARSYGGLSVFDFLRIRTWLELDGADERLTSDTATLARAEGLEAHARSAEARLSRGWIRCP
ncbi:MAG: histidinol dehydrogenase [Spirochaetae bacterium HGW-Spirochaetae-7]|nr:MAG: histidinol dehydrogenase [Spirochaetae bacterium HGW-Spirochaetae-7]